MATLTPTTAKGRTQYEKGTPFRTGDDRADNQDANGYVHDPIEYSGTEKDEQNSYAFFLQLMLQGGRLSLLIRNNSGVTINAGQLVYINGYDVTNSRFTIAKAKADAETTLAHFFLQANLVTATDGVAYAVEELGSLNTAGTAVNDPVYLSEVTAGNFTFTKPTGTNIPQIVGRVTNVHASTGKIQFITRGFQEFLMDNLVSTAKLKDLSVTTAKIAANAITSAKIVPQGVEQSDIKNAAISTIKLSNTVADGIPQQATLTKEAEGIPVTDAIRVTIQVQDIQANNLAKRVVVGVWLSTSDFGAASGTIVSTIVGTGAKDIDGIDPTTQLIQVLTNTSGQALIHFVKTGAGTLFMMCSVGTDVKSISLTWV